MIKVIFLLKRKPGITHEQFKDHYEKSHSRLAQKHFGHLMTRYVRNYVSEARGARSLGANPFEFGYDCMAEWVLPNEAALDEIFRMFKDPVIGKEFYDDEERFLDRDAVVQVRSREEDVFDTGVEPTEAPTHDTLATRPG